MKEKLLARNMGCTVDEAIDLMERYMGRYPAVKHFYAEAIEETRETGYAFSLLGRRRFLPEIISMSEYDRFRAERQAVNMQIQGTAADAVTMAMILIDEAKLDERFGCEMLLQVHDELIFQCPEETSPAPRIDGRRFPYRPSVLQNLGHAEELESEALIRTAPARTLASAPTAEVVSLVQQGVRAVGAEPEAVPVVQPRPPARRQSRTVASQLRQERPRPEG